MYRIAEEQKIYGNSHGYDILISIKGSGTCDVCGDDISYKPRINIRMYPRRGFMDSKTTACVDCITKIIDNLLVDCFNIKTEEDDFLELEPECFENEDLIGSLEKARDIVDKRNIVKISEEVSIMKRFDSKISGGQFSLDCYECCFGDNHECGDYVVILGASNGICRNIIKDVSISKSNKKFDRDNYTINCPSWRLSDMENYYEKAVDCIEDIDSAILSFEI